MDSANKPSDVTVILKIFLLLLANAVAVMAISMGQQKQDLGLRNRTASQYDKLHHFRSLLNTRIQRQREKIETLFQTEYMTEARDREYSGISTAVENSADFKPFHFSMHNRTHAALKASRGTQTKKSIFWVQHITYPTQQEGTCLQFRYEDAKRKTYIASFQDHCKEIYHILLRWKTSTRLSQASTKGQNIPVPHGDLNIYGVVFIPTNPSSAALWFWGKDDDTLSSSLQYPIWWWRHVPNTDPKSLYDTIEGELIDENFDLHKFKFPFWKKRNRLIIREFETFMNNQSRSFKISRIIQRSDEKGVTFENGEQLMGQESSMDFIVRNGEPKAITIGDTTISPRDIGEKIDVRFDPQNEVCMRMTLMNDETSSGKEFYYAEHNCALIFLQFKRFKKEQ